jgi:hypothetical protein
MMKKYESGVSFCNVTLPPTPTQSFGYQFSKFSSTSVSLNHDCFIWKQMLQFCCICGGDDVSTPVVQVGPRFTSECLHFHASFIHFLCSTFLLHVLLLTKMGCYVYKIFIYL